jgi:hypothetical protein
VASTPSLVGTVGLHHLESTFLQIPPTILIERELQLVTVDGELSASDWHQASSAPSRHAILKTNLAGACVFSFRQTPTNFFNSSSETLAGSDFGFSGYGPKISSVIAAAIPPALGDVPLHITPIETLLLG